MISGNDWLYKVWRWILSGNKFTFKLVILPKKYEKTSADYYNIQSIVFFEVVFWRTHSSSFFCPYLQNVSSSRDCKILNEKGHFAKFDVGGFMNNFPFILFEISEWIYGRVLANDNSIMKVFLWRKINHSWILLADTSMETRINGKILVDGDKILLK